MNHLLLIACHTNSEIKKKSLLHNIKYFSELSRNIVIIQSIECKNKLLETNIKKIKKNIIFYYIPNDQYLCHGKWCSYLSTIDYTQYDNITLTNDSYLITKSLNNYKNLINKDVELVALLDSYDTTYHYPDFLRTYNKTGINKITNYYYSNKDKIKCFHNAIIYYEINSSSLFDNVKVLYHNNDNNNMTNIHSNNKELKNYLYNLNYPIIKIKKLISNYYPNNFKIPKDFKVTEYRSLNIDIANMNDLELRNHFINCGINDGRLYKKNQSSSLPDFLTNYLKFNNLLYIISKPKKNQIVNKKKIQMVNKTRFKRLSRIKLFYYH